MTESKTPAAALRSFKWNLQQWWLSIRGYLWLFIPVIFKNGLFIISVAGNKRKNWLLSFVPSSIACSYCPNPNVHYKLHCEKFEALYFTPLVIQVSLQKDIVTM